MPTHGVSVGLGTISRRSRAVRLGIHGEGKRTAAARVLASPAFEADWPATFNADCRDAQVRVDRAAAAGSHASVEHG